MSSRKNPKFWHRIGCLRHGAVDAWFDNSPIAMRMIWLPTVIDSTVPLVSGLPLTSNAEDESNIDVRHVAIQGHIASRSMPDEQFTLAAADGSTDQRACDQDLYGLQDLVDPLLCGADLEPGQVVEDTIEVVEDLGGQLDSSHVAGQPPSLRATGLRGLSPRARASRWALA